MSKICCIVNRDEPKDVFDIVSIAETYSFNWKDMLLAAKRKQLLNEVEVAIRLEESPTQSIKNNNWVFSEINTQDFDKKLKRIIRDILLGGDNSLGEAKPEITEASLNYRL